MNQEKVDVVTQVWIRRSLSVILCRETRNCARIIRETAPRSRLDFPSEDDRALKKKRNVA